MSYGENRRSTEVRALLSDVIRDPRQYVCRVVIRNSLEASCGMRAMYEAQSVRLDIFDASGG